MKRFWKSKYSYLIIAAVVIFSYLAILAKVPETFGQGDFFPYGVRVMRDDYDRSIYRERAAWFLENKIPYKEVFSEYPQVITYYFALPAIFTSSVQSYILLHSFFMACIFLGLFYVTLQLLEYLHKPFYLSLLLLLPSFLYHALNRFDVFAVFLVSLSLLALFRKRSVLGLAILATAVLVKWYPAILLPFYFLYIQGETEDPGILFKPFVTFFGILLGVFIFSFIWSGSAIFQPYLWHMNKGIYYQSVLGILSYYSNFLHLHIIPLLKKVFVIFEFVPFLVGLYFLRKKYYVSPESLIILCAFSILVFNFFSPAYAPQFFLWVMALALLAIKNKKEIAVLIVLDILNYLLYPFAFALLSTKYIYINNLIVILQTVLFIYLGYSLISKNIESVTDRYKL